VQPPDTQYVTRPDGVAIAWQQFGDGPIDILWSPGFISHLDLAWTISSLVRIYRRLASFARVIVYDKPGTGLSDPLDHIPTLEERMDDIRAVLDAAGSERTAILGISEGGPTAVLYAATYPERVSSLALYGTFARMPSPGDELPPGLSPETLVEMEGRVNNLIANWGKGSAMDIFAPTEPEKTRRLFASFERAAASPSMVKGLFEAVGQIDVRAVAETVGVPTVVVHRKDEIAVPIPLARELAAAIPGAKMVEQSGRNHAPWIGDPDALVDAVEAFLTGARHVDPEPDRMLATVLFTDIVGSTELAARMGDADWRQLLERHDALIREEVEAHRGRVVKTTGDGMLAVFDGPARAIRCAEAARDALDEIDVPIRAGVHTGECEAMGDDIGGLAVHIGARVAAHAEAGEVLVSSTVADLVVGSGLQFAERGTHELKGVPGEWKLLAVGEGGQRIPVTGERKTTASDRFTLRLAARAPRALRFANRLASGRA
jgi:class 3 adenylate cyclase